MRQTYFVVILIILILTGCSNVKESELTLADDSFASDKSYDGKRVSFVGYFTVPDNDIWETRGAEFITLQLSSKPCGMGDEAEHLLDFRLEESSIGKNKIFIPSTFDESNVVIITNDKQRLKCNQKIGLSGTIQFLQNMPPVKLRKVDPKTLQATEYAKYAYDLLDVRIDAVR
jgi:hypothetical protein